MVKKGDERISESGVRVTTPYSVNGIPVSYAYDNDGLLTGAGALSLQRVVRGHVEFGVRVITPFTRTSAEGRQSLMWVNNKGLPVLNQQANLNASRFDYDSRGHLETITQGTGEETRTGRVRRVRGQSNNSGLVALAELADTAVL